MAELLFIFASAIKQTTMEEEKNMAAEQQTAEETAAQAQQESVKEEQKAASKADKKKKKEDPLQKKVEELTDNLAKEKESYIRLMAEFETFRRRSAEERLSLINTASADTIKELLPVLDACESATKMLAESSDEAAKEGTKLIFDKLMTALRKRGLKAMETNGEKFDADRHEAIAQIPAPTPELKGIILDTTRTGYELGGKIIRYPQVVVGA